MFLLIQVAVQSCGVHTF